jgi:hypothetical protein
VSEPDRLYRSVLVPAAATTAGLPLHRGYRPVHRRLGADDLQATPP